MNFTRINEECKGNVSHIIYKFRLNNILYMYSLRSLAAISRVGLVRVLNARCVNYSSLMSRKLESNSKLRVNFPRVNYCFL